MDRVVLITGAAGGIGSAALGVFSHAGWTVLAVDRRAATLSAAHRLYKADVSVETEVRALFEDVRRDVDHLDALVNNAAIQVGKPLLKMTVADWDETMASNLRSAFLMSREAYPLLRQAKGAVVNVASVHAVATSGEIAAYAASKGGLVALTRAMAIEFAPDGVRANSVLPGAVDTDMLREGLNRSVHGGGGIDERLAQLGRRTALGRVGRPEEIAECILFLADAAKSSFITGQALIVDGGATSRLSTE